MPTKAELFLELAPPDKQGFSREVPVKEFKGKYIGLRFGNGGDWARDAGSLGKKYNVVRHKKGKGNRITHVELQGYNKNPKHKSISQSVRKALKGQKCRVLGITDVEIDHKDGRYDDSKVSNTGNQKAEDFQPLSKAVNYAKRQHCKRCAETGLRFDAKTLGYKVSQVKGNGKYRGTCVGCYWYDPHAFNQSLHLKP